MNLIDYPTRDALMAGLSKVLESALRGALAQKDQVSFAIPGGTTPGPLFDVLSTADLDWSRVHVLLTDERWVPEDDAQSNAALIRNRLLTGAAAAATFTAYYTADTDIGTAAQSLSHTLKGSMPIDVLLLGMGTDMHTASLFPDTAALEAALAPDAPMFMPIQIADQETMRFSLTAPALSSARDIHLLMTGTEKHAALLRANTLTPMEAPVQTVLPTATIHWSAE